ncbi:transcriptional regulator [Xanthomonas bromi]|uniref:Transcriptional regulator n=1 Tax=Xanthomonas bromi TaxID=56449 RepID=A0A1C3NL97_9XANT|nr:transcriptional regulator [Xanthomonas bromi]
MNLRPILLPALGVFAAAARHQNFAHAAEELHLTASAVNHHVRKLEALLGVILFQRLPRGVKLTAEGRQLADAATAALAEIAAVAGNLQPREDAIPLRVTTLRSLSYCWLLPRLPRLCRAHPHIRLDLQSDPAFSRFEEGGPELGIRYGQGAWPGLTSHHLMDDELFPVASPSLPEVAAAHTGADCPVAAAERHVAAGLARLVSRRPGARHHPAADAYLQRQHRCDARGGVRPGRRAGTQARRTTLPATLRTGAPARPHAQGPLRVLHPSHREPSPAAALFIDWLKREALDERTPMPALPAELVTLPAA